MKRVDFDRIAPNAPADQYQYFRQRDFRSRHQDLADLSLCSALVELWYVRQCLGGDLIRELAQPKETLIQALRLLQLKSHYPTLASSDALASLSKQDQAMFYHKYGTNDPGGLKELLEEHDVIDFLELDLCERFQAKVVNTRTFSSDAVGLSRALAGSELAIVILRYLRERDGTMIRFSHRMAYRSGSDGAHIFFDPNAGEVIIRDAERFQAWFGRFWEQSNYRKRESVPGFPHCTVYHLHSNP